MMTAFAPATLVHASAWTAHDTRLIAVAGMGIAIIVALVVGLKTHPFLALILGSAFVGFASGVGSSDVVSNFETGVGSTLKEVGLLIALGAMFGKLMADSGGADQVIDKLLSKAPRGAVPWAMAVVAVIIGLPMFFEIGLVLLLPVVVLVAQRSGLPLFAVAAHATRAWRLKSWDRFMIPRPFTRVVISYGAAAHVQAGDARAASNEAPRFQQLMEDAERAAAAV